MAGFFPKERIAELYAGYDEVEQQFRELRNRIHLRTYKTKRGAEFAKHGLPPHDNVVEASMAIQAFVMNAFGCLDNIAWVLVHEKDIKGKGGADLEPKEVGLGKKYVIKKLSKEFLTLLAKHQNWLGNLISFRDALAHRIPLYIPPYTVPQSNVEKYNELEKAKWEESARSNPEEYERLKAEQLELCRFVPGMMHSIFEQGPQVEFHSQLLNDYLTIDEYARTLLEELDRE